MEHISKLDSFLSTVEGRAYRMSVIATGDQAEALDIVQDAMFSLFKKYQSRPEGEWKPLFYKLLQNRIRDWYRRRAIRNRWRDWLGWWGDSDDVEQNDPLAELPDRTGLSPADQSMQNEALVAVDAALRSLPLRQQQVFLLRAWEEMSVTETAEVMGVSPGSVKTHYSRAVRALRRILEEHRI